MILSENRSHANRQRRQPALLSTRPVTPPKVGIALIPTFPTGNILNHVAPVSVKGKRCSFTSPRDLAEAFHGTWLTAGARVQLGILDVLRDRLDEAKSVVDQAAAEAGRDPAELGMEGRVSWGDGGAEQVAERVGRWRDAGASHVSVNTMGAGLATVDEHLGALTGVAAALGLRRP